MKLAFIADPLASFKLAKDSTYAMLVEAAKRGHELYFALQEGLMWKGGRVLGEFSRLALTGTKDSWYRAEAPKETPLAQFDAVLMRKDPPFDAEYVASNIAKMGLTETTVAFAPWIVVMVLYLLLVTYVPQIATWLPDLIYARPG